MADVSKDPFKTFNVCKGSFRTPPRSPPPKDSPQEPGNQPDNAGPTSGDHGAPAAGADPAISNAGPADPTTYNPAATPQPAPYQALPGYAYPSNPPQPGGGKKTGVVIAAVIGLVAGIGIGVAGFAIATSGNDPKPSTTTTDDKNPQPEGDYSMDSVTNACDLVDPTMLHRWASTPEMDPVSFGTRPRSLGCGVAFGDPSAVDEFVTNAAGINFEAEFNEELAASAYDTWKRHDTDTTGPNLAFGEVTEIGSQGYWFSKRDGSLLIRQSYTVAVQDSNVSVKVRIYVWRGESEPPVTWEEMDEIAKAEVQLALDGLKEVVARPSLAAPSCSTSGRRPTCAVPTCPRRPGRSRS